MLDILLAVPRKALVVVWIVAGICIAIWRLRVERKHEEEEEEIRRWVTTTF